MFLIVLIPLQVTFASLPSEEAKQSDFSRLNLTGNKSDLSGNTTTNATDFSRNLIVEPQAKQLDFIGGNLTAEPSEFIGENRSMSNFSGNMTQAGPQDFNVVPGDLATPNCYTSYSATACDMARDLISLSADKIANYGLGENPSHVIEQTLQALDPGNLTKVLQSISPLELTSIKDKLTPQTLETILSKVPEPQHTELVNKVSSLP
jgi:hypothetical protein